MSWISKRVLPADIIPVVDVQSERDDIVTVGYLPQEPELDTPTAPVATMAAPET